MAENMYMLMLSFSFLVAAGVLITFFWGWAADWPEVLADVHPEVREEPDRSTLTELLQALCIIPVFFLLFVPQLWELAATVLPSLAGLSPEKERPDSAAEKMARARTVLKRTVTVISFNGRILPTIAGGLRDRLLAWPEGAPLDLMVMSGRPCAFDDGTRVYYNRREMLRVADAAGIGQSYWLMLAGLALIADALLPGVRDWLGEALPAFEAYPWLRWVGPQMSLYFFLLAVGWFIIRGARSRVLTARVERAVKPLMAARNQSRPDQAASPVPLAGPEISRPELIALAALPCFGLSMIAQAWLLNLM